MLLVEKLVDGEVLVSYTVDPWTDPEDGKTYTRIRRDIDMDGEFDDGDGVTVMTTSEEVNRLPRTRTVKRTFCDAGGRAICALIELPWAARHIAGTGANAPVLFLLHSHTRVTRP